MDNACLKDSNPLPNIDSLVDSASGCELLNFIDAFSGYNQIWMHLIYEDKIVSIIEMTNYYYKVMSFGLKNVEATYQRLMDKILDPFRGRIEQAYVEDMVVTFKKST